MKLMDTNLCSDSATTITVSSANASFPASNLKHPFRSKRWRSTGVTSETVLFDFQTIQAVDSVVILWPKEDGIRLTSSAVITVQANATNVWTSPALSQTMTVDNTYSVASAFFSTDKSFRFWRVVVQDPGNPWGFIEIGMIWIGKSLAVGNAQNGFTYSLVDRSNSVTTTFGHQYTDQYPLQAVLEFQYQFLDYSVVQTLENAFRRNGIQKPVLIALDPEEAVFDKDHLLVYGIMSNGFRLQHVNYNIFNSDKLTVTELS